MSGDFADDQDDMTIAYMLGFERGKDAAAATITAQAQEIERLRAELAKAQAVNRAFQGGLVDQPPMTAAIRKETP